MKRKITVSFYSEDLCEGVVRGKAVLGVVGRLFNAFREDNGVLS